MAESAVSFLLVHLSEWLRVNRQLLGGLETEVKYIQDEMEQIRAFLRVADAEEESDPGLKEWVGKVREISYDVQDILDIYLFLFHDHPDTNRLRDCIIKSYCWIKDLKARHKIASEIQEIKGRLDNVTKSYNKYREMYTVTGGGSINSTQNEKWDGWNNALLFDEDVVGIENPKEQVIDWIMSMDNGLDVMSIVGMGGLGKTTLAKKVYNDKKVKMHFDCHVWIVTSDYKEVEHLLTSLIKKLVEEMKDSPLPSKLEDMSADVMREFIYKFLEQKKYIIVLDDVWDISRWDAIKVCFPEGASHGCIIITTRFKHISNAACSKTNHVYNLEPLPLEESEKLFYKKAFPRNPCPPYLEEYAGSILKRCEGLPLAIVVIGGLLATKDNRVEEWELFNRSLGDKLEKDGELDKISKLLSLSYYDLPYHLKYCFLYLSMFPEGCLLDKWKIIRLWVAEGFVQVKQGMTTEEVAESYLNEILSRSLIQVAETTLDGRPKTFRVHDLLREYISSKSREQNIVSIHRDGGGEMVLPNKIRRIVIQKSLNFIQGKYSSFKYLRTLILVDIEYGDLRVIKELLEKCRLLKVLSLEGAPLETIPNEVYKLYHLKHLSLRNSMVKIISKSIKNLQNLETLDLKHTNVTELPIEILKLSKLRHLLVYKYELNPGSFVYEVQGAKAPYDIGNCLLSLQKLCHIDADDIKIVKGIGKLTQLRRLGIRKLRKADEKELCSSIAKLTNLRSLTISSAEEEDEMLDLDYHSSSSLNLPFLRRLNLSVCLEKVPQWLSSLVGLTFLSLRYCKIREDGLQCLESLPNLAFMAIRDAYVDGLTFKAHGFKKLKNLWLMELKHLTFVIIEKGSMPLLYEFTMGICKLVTDVPRGIEHLSNLQLFDLFEMGDEFWERVNEEKREGGELSHIPTIRSLKWTHRGSEDIEFEMIA